MDTFVKDLTSALPTPWTSTLPTPWTWTSPSPPPTMPTVKASLLLDPGMWDGMNTTFRLWWAKTKAWTQDQLEREAMDKETGQAVAMQLQGKAKGFTLQLFEMVEVSGEWPL